MAEISMLNALNTYGTTKTDSAFSGKGSVGSSSPTSSLTMTDFYKLLATQLQYQDADNPMDTGEMMNQLVQTQMSQSIQQMTTAISDLSIVNMFSYASSMMGKEVTVAEVDKDGKYTGEETKGVVTGITLGDIPSIYINGKEYSLVQVMSVGEVPEKVEEPDEGEDDKE